MVAVFVVRTVACTTTLVAVAAVPAVADTAAWLAPAGTVTEAGTESRVGLELLSVTTVPPTGAAAVRNTVKLPVLPEVMVAADDRLARSTGAGTTWMVTAFVVRTVPCTTTLVAVVAVPAVADTAAWLAPAGTVTEAGTESRVGLELLSVTTIPPTGAAAVRNTVKLPVVPEVMVAADDKLAMSTGAGTTWMVAVFVVRIVACTTTLVAVAAVPAVADTADWLDPAGTVTEAGTESRVGLELLSVTTVPPTAAAVRNTVKLPVVPEVM